MLTSEIQPGDRFEHARGSYIIEELLGYEQKVTPDGDKVCLAVLVRFEQDGGTGIRYLERGLDFPLTRPVPG